MKTRIFTLIVSLFITAMAFAYDVKIDGIYYELVPSENAAHVTCDYNLEDAEKGSYSGAVIIPESFTHQGTSYKVVSIMSKSFEYSILLTSIKIPNSITSIGNRAFRSCISLKSIELPNSVTSIGDHAFYGCSSLTSINIPEGVTEIGECAFYNCSALTSIELPNSVTTIEYRAFSNCTSLTSVTISKGVTTIGISAFSYCSALTSINIPEGVIEIDNYAFNNCSSLKSIELPNSVTSIGDHAFYGCSALTSINIPEKITEIQSYTFYGCSSLTSITIPDSVTTIEDRAFSNCTSLTSITIPESVTSMESYVFECCGNLETIIILCEVPPTIDPNNKTFEDCYHANINANIKVPCGSIDIYKLLYPKQSEQIIENFPLLTTTSNNDNYGHITIIKQNSCDDNIAQIKAEANKGYHFEKWSDGNTENPRKITVTEDMTLTAEFAIDQYQVTLKSNGNGSVTGSGTYDYGTEVTIEAIADKGYHFEKWSDGNTENPRTITVTEDINLTAEFAIDQYQVTLKSNGNGSVTGSGTYDYGTKITIEAIANKGYHFEKWSDGNTENPRTITVTEDIELSATFELDETPVENVQITSANVYSRNGILHVEGAETDYYVLDMAGRLIYSGRDTELQLPRGVYVVNVGGEVQKVVL